MPLTRVLLTTVVFFTIAETTVVLAGDLPPPLSATRLKVGAVGLPGNMRAKVLQVLDNDRMLVGIENNLTGNNAYDVIILLKCPTAGITDGKKWYSREWRTVTGGDLLAITGTTTYRTVTGGTRTVFVAEPREFTPEQREAVLKQKRLQNARRPATASRVARIAAEEAAKRRIAAERRRLAAKIKAELDKQDKPNRDAALNLAYAKRLIERGEEGKARERLLLLIKEAPDAPAVPEAKRLLESLGK